MGLLSKTQVLALQPNKTWPVKPVEGMEMATAKRKPFKIVKRDIIVFQGQKGLDKKFNTWSAKSFLLLFSWPKPELPWFEKYKKVQPPSNFKISQQPRKLFYLKTSWRSSNYSHSIPLRYRNPETKGARDRKAFKIHITLFFPTLLWIDCGF